MDSKQEIIKVGRIKAGIVGLRQTIDEVRSMNPRSDEEISEALFERLKTGNYIPESAVEEYKKAFLREYNKMTGKHIREEYDIPEIKVLGPGCMQCDMLGEKLLKLFTELDLTVDFEHVKDINEYAGHGVFATPALVINGTLVSTGKVPSEKKLRAWLQSLR